MAILFIQFLKCVELRPWICAAVLSSEVRMRTLFSSSAPPSSSLISSRISASAFHLGHSSKGGTSDSLPSASLLGLDQVLNCNSLKGIDPFTSG